MFAIATCNSTFKDLLSKLFDFFLILYPVFIINILTFFILIKAFMSIFTLLNNAYCLVARRSNIIQVVNTSVIQHILNVLDLNVSVKWHVRHHYSNIFRRNISIHIKIIPIITNSIKSTNKIIK